MNIIALTKRQYMSKDLIDDRYWRIRHLPLELAALGHSIHGFCLSYQNKIEARFSGNSVEWCSINAGALKIPGLIRYYKRASRYARHADLIWASSDSIYGILGFLLSKRYKIPCVFDLYDNYEFFLVARLPVLKQLYRWVVKKIDGVTCISRPLAKLVQTYGRKKPTKVLENAVQTELYRPLNMRDCRKALRLPENGLFIGTAGTIHPNRGISVLFKVFDQLKEIYPDLGLVLAGPCHMDIPKDPRIVYLGNLPEDRVPLVWNALNVAVVCNTHNEFGKYCFPQKACEIMACDTPIVGAKVGSMLDILAGHPSEWLYHPDDAADLARAIKNRLQDTRTNYTGVKTWSDIAADLDSFIRIIMMDAA